MSTPLVIPVNTHVDIDPNNVVSGQISFQRLVNEVFRASGEISLRETVTKLTIDPNSGCILYDVIRK